MTIHRTIHDTTLPGLSDASALSNLVKQQATTRLLTSNQGAKAPGLSLGNYEFTLHHYENCEG